MVTGDKLAGGIENPPLLRRRRHAFVICWPPAFHLAEYDQAATSHHKVDFAAGRPVPPGQKLVTRADKSGKRGKFDNPARTLPAGDQLVSVSTPFSASAAR